MNIISIQRVRRQLPDAECQNLPHRRVLVARPFSNKDHTVGCEAGAEPLGPSFPAPQTVFFGVLLLVRVTIVPLGIERERRDADFADIVEVLGNGVPDEDGW